MCTTSASAQNSNSILAAYYNEKSDQVWVNRTDKSIQYFDMHSNELNTLEGVKADYFWDYGNYYLIKNNSLLFEIDKTSHSVKKLPITITTPSNALFTYYPAKNSTLFIIKIVDFMDYYPAVIDIQTGQKKALSSQSFEIISDIHEDESGNYWLTDNNLYRYNRETNEWNLIFKKTKETDWLQDIQSTKNDLYVSTWKSLILKFDITNPGKEVSILSNVAPFKIKTFDVSQNGTISVALDRRIAWLENGDWTEIPSHKLNTIEGDIHQIQFIGNKKVLINTGYSFGIISLN
ncbi:hypothetical protein EP331_15340 [bacterium]|nr:MAG: hypothetical protein EP331_15340 [bacterium]